MAELTAEQREAQAQLLRNRAHESFERCDTDGFLSQWADGLMAQKHDLAARIARNGGCARFTGLYLGDRRIRARLVNGRFGQSWLIHEADRAVTSGRAFLPTGKNSRVLRSLGLSERSEMAPAIAALEGRGRGLSGSAWVAAQRIGCPWGSDAALAAEG